MFYRFELRLKVRRYRFTYNGYTNWNVYGVNICFVRIPFQAPLYTHTIMTSVAIFQYHKRMELTFHILSVILELVPSTVIFWTELSCWRKIYSNKAMFLLSCRHRYKKYMVVITIWLTATNYPTLWCIVWQHAFERRIYRCLEGIYVILTHYHIKCYPYNK
jgi:hypothetical protein